MSSMYTNNKKKSSAFLVGITLLTTSLWITSVSALTQTPPKDATSTVQFAVINDTNLTDVKVSEKNGTYTGTFSIQQKRGLQNNLVYGVVLYDTKNNILDVRKLGTESVVYEGEIKRHTLNYTIPKYANGTVIVTLELFTQEGLKVGTHILGKKSVSGTPSSLSCKTDKGGSVMCTVTKKDAITATLYSNGYFGKLIKSVSQEKKAGDIFSASALFPSLAPGKYFIIVQASSTNELEATAYQPQGLYATLLNFMFSKTPNSAAPSLTGYVVGSAKKLVATVTMTNNDGTNCDEKKIPVIGRVFSSAISSLCREGKAVISLADEGGHVYQKITYPFSLLSVKDSKLSQTAITKLNEDQSNPKVKQEVEKETSSNARTIGYGALLVIIIGGVAYYFMKMKKVPTAVAGIVFALALSFAQTQQTHALLFTGQTFEAGDVANICSITVTSDKSQYLQGDTMILNAQTDITYDAYSRNGSCNIGWRDSGSGPEYDISGIPGGAPAWAMASGDPGLGPVSANQNQNFALGSLSVGGHWIALRLGLDDSPYICPPFTACSTWAEHTQDFNFTITNPPSVNLFFSTESSTASTLF